MFLGSLGGHFEDGLSWLMMELCWDIIGSRMAAKIVIWPIKNAKMSQNGAQGVAKLSQDGILGLEFEVWRDLGRSWGSLGSHFERCWLEVGLSWLMLEPCCDISGDKMAAKMAILAIKDAKMSQDGAQEAAKVS